MPHHSLALITGATSGIGEALSHLLASKNISLLLTGRNREKLEALKKELSLQVSVDTFPADLAHEKERRALLDWMEEKKADLVINNAGVGFYGEAITAIPEQLEILQVNVLALAEITFGAVNFFVREKMKGTVLNVSSVAGYQVFPGFTSYAASKAFVNTFTRSLAFEVQSKGIRILLSCPGQVATPFSSRASHRNLQRKPNFFVMSDSFAAYAIWEQIQSGKPVQIFDWKYKIGIYLSALIPTRWLAPLLQNQILKRKINHDN